MHNNYIKKTLKNGVRLYLYIDKTMRKTLVDYSINYGSSGKWFDFYLDDKLYHVLPGCAHFLEHMLGEHSKYGNIYKYFSDKKYETNGGTIDDRTHYYFIGVDDVKDSMEKLIRTIDEPVFTKEDVEKTKMAIIEETKRVLNDKNRISTALYARNLYKNLDLYHTSLSVIGNQETTKSLDYETLKICYDAFYYDENKSLLIAGNIDEKEMIEYVENIYDTIKPHKKRVKNFDYGDLVPVKTRKDVFYMPANDEFVTLGFKQRNEKYSKKEIWYYLKFMVNSKFASDTKFIESLKEKEIISTFGYYGIFFLDDNYYDFYFKSNVKNSDLYTKEILKYIKINDFSEKDFKLFIRGEISNEALAVDIKYKRMVNFAFRNCYSDDFNDMEFLKTLSFDSFIKFYESLEFTNYTLAIVRNKEE